MRIQNGDLKHIYVAAACKLSTTYSRVKNKPVNPHRGNEQGCSICISFFLSSLVQLPTLLHQLLFTVSVTEVVELFANDYRF